MKQNGHDWILGDMGTGILPEPFLERMKQLLGTEYDKFLAVLEQERYQALRLNRLKLDSQGRSAADIFSAQNDAQTEMRSSMTGAFAHLSKIAWAADGYYYQSADQPGKHPFHEAGLYYIQEPSAMAPAELLDVQPGERVLDLCAAPGGKSTQIAAKLMGRGLLICNEIHPARAKILSENIERMGICNAMVTNETPKHLAELFPDYFDKILVDAPCSGEGMFRKNQTACEEWSPENVELCAQRQDEILDYAAGMLRPGGRLVYSTCTFAPTENEGSISRFLDRHSDFTLLPIDKSAFGPVSCDGVPAWSCSAKSSVSKWGCTPESDALLCHNSTPTQMSSLNNLQNTLRLWPQYVKGEGHFAALLQKDGEPQKDGGHQEDGALPKDGGQPNYNETRSTRGIVKGIAEKELGELALFCQENLLLTDHTLSDHTLSNYTLSDHTFSLHTLSGQLGCAVGMDCETVFIRFGENLYLVPAQLPELKGLKVLRPGLHLGELKKNRFEPSHALALALHPCNAARIWNLGAGGDQAAAYLNGQTFSAEGEKGWYLICLDGFGLGWGKLAGGVMKNHYPKGLRIHSPK